MKLISAHSGAGPAHGYADNLHRFTQKIPNATIVAGIPPVSAGSDMFRRSDRARCKKALEGTAAHDSPSGEQFVGFLHRQWSAKNGEAIGEGLAELGTVSYAV